MLLTKADRFQGEEVRGQDKYLAWLTGFTGSAGAALILADSAVVATDATRSDCSKLTPLTRPLTQQNNH